MHQGLLRAAACHEIVHNTYVVEDLKAKGFRDDRKVSDVVYVIVRRFMYGDVNGSQPPGQVTEEDHESP